MHQTLGRRDIRRTTVAASRASLETLAAEARRRGVSLSALMAEAIEEKASKLHASRRPRLGVARSTDGRSAADVTSEPVAHPPS
jgi:ribbon-helix-helix CopG family protein